MVIKYPSRINPLMINDILLYVLESNLVMIWNMPLFLSSISTKPSFDEAVMPLLTHDWMRICAISQGPVIICLCLCNHHCKQGEMINTSNCILAKRTFSTEGNSRHAARESANVITKQGDHPVCVYHQYHWVIRLRNISTLNAIVDYAWYIIIYKHSPFVFG